MNTITSKLPNLNLSNLEELKKRTFLPDEYLQFLEGLSLQDKWSLVPFFEIKGRNFFPLRVNGHHASIFV